MQPMMFNVNGRSASSPEVVVFQPVFLSSNNGNHDLFNHAPPSPHIPLKVEKIVGFAAVVYVFC
jgi:hypothetical protein